MRQAPLRVRAMEWSKEHPPPPIMPMEEPMEEPIGDSPAASGAPRGRPRGRPRGHRGGSRGGSLSQPPPKLPRMDGSEDEDGVPQRASKVLHSIS